MTERAYNFSAGPCALPLPVLEALRDELVDYHGAGFSLIETSHRGPDYSAVHDEAMQLAKTVYGAPDEFEVLLLQGGATHQFAMVPMNLLHDGGKGAYVHCGIWSKGAVTDARSHGDIYMAWDGEGDDFTRMPTSDELQLRPDTRYLHITSNETINGIQMFDWPDLGIPLVADMSSDYMTRPIPWHLFDIIYGGAQKNLGPSGLTVIFIRRDIAKRNNKALARSLRYDVQINTRSLYNTPPVFTIYAFGKVLKWMQANGGIAAFAALSKQKSALVYGAIDHSDGFYRSPVEHTSRSLMNAVFHLPTDELHVAFLREAEDRRLVNLEGHRSVGGIRASLYNAMPFEGVQALVQFMHDFHQQHG